MNLAQVIHQRWAAAAALESLLPAARVYTGINVDPTAPYAVIAKQSDRPIGRHNDGSAVDVVGVRIEVFHDDHDAAAEIVRQIKTTFDCTSFDLAGGDKTLDMRRVNDWETQTESGVWMFSIEFNCTVYLESGA